MLRLFAPDAAPRSRYAAADLAMNATGPPQAADLGELLHQLADLSLGAEPLRVVIERGGRRIELTAGQSTG